MVPKNTIFKVISYINLVAICLLPTLTEAKTVYNRYHMEANSTKTFELRDFNLDGENENTYLIQNDSPIQVQIISSSLIKTKKRAHYYSVRFDVITPKLWLPKTFYFNIQSTNNSTIIDHNILIITKLCKKRWLLYGLVVLFGSLVLFGGVYYKFSKG